MILDSRAVSRDNRAMPAVAEPPKSPSAASYLSPEAERTLVDLRMPAPVVDYVRTHPGLPPWCFFLSLALWLTLSVALVLAVAIPLTRAPLPAWLVHFGLFPRDTLLIDVQLLSPILGLVMLCFLLPSVALSLLTLLQRSFATRAALLSIQRAANKQNDLWLLKRSLQRIPSHLGPEDYLVAFHGGLIRTLLTLGVWILIPTLLLGAWETLASSYATPRGIRAGGMFAWPRPFVAWDDVQKVSTGAINNGSKSEPVYVLHYSGSSRDLSRWRMLDGNSDNLPVIVQIDNELRQRDVPWEIALYEYGIHKGERRWDQAAFRTLRSRLTPADQAMFDRVYRYDR
jgi:hypothetical protein